ncbi:urea ABC transporter permease subunit UrtC [Caldilinea aerophila]|uniref:Putative ABC transporter permease protein n=1 Tax=Caldilinea aerophila (strain DSM 14535 / JCM 11387 / NBRC 104270 / STL-6-O1) TaxID=926550 RepID=I0HZB5_CALAS|nr:urea ABC transporter permease subunit UrtC [Caldilinea aerophila]BAL98352.1 putative ABC transporter permease protein [Caldilinea aerophila DSM 14535 = NBRC 104270]
MNAKKITRFVKEWGGFTALMLILLAAPLFLSDFRLIQLGKFLTFAIVALGLDLIWGYGGMLSLGQGLFFGLGAYGFAMYLKLQASGGKLPDFMFWSGLKELPWFWVPFQSPVFALLAALLIPGFLAGLLGYFIFRSRVKGVYFSIITQALTLLVSIWFVGQQAYTGGTNGITNLGSAQIFGHFLQSPTVQRGFYLVTVIALASVYLLCRWLTTARFGRLLVALRDSEDRARFLGYDPVHVKVLVFVLSAMIAALAGILFVPQVGIISPSSMGVVPSIEMVVWVAVGGRGTLLGAVLGALLVSYGRSYFSETYPDIWQIFLGILFIGSVLLFPQGLAGALTALFTRAQRLLSRSQAPEDVGKESLIKVTATHTEGRS